MKKKDGHFQQILALWKLERKIHFLTVIKFLRPNPCPITEFSTVCETRHRSIDLSKISDIKYTHITLDVGAVEEI